MSIEELAAATKIPRRSLEMLEEDRYDALPGPVFVKGFIRCVSRVLHVDVQAVMDLLYERERAALASKRGGRPAAAAAPVAPNDGLPARTMAPRRAKANQSTPSWSDVVRNRLPSPAVFLWVVVAAFVAAVVLAAFNLVGGGSGGAS